MAALANLTKEANINVTPREIDFVTRFGNTWEALRDILGIMRPIRKVPGAVLKSKAATVVLQSGAVAEGAEIPFSQAAVTEIPYAEMNIEKYAKGVSVEAIKSYGYDVAVGMTDDQFLVELQANVMGRFYSYLNTGLLTNAQTTYQMVLAMAKGLVVNEFKRMHKAATQVVAFANVLDVYEYLGAANITVQTAFGFNYVQNFMGLDVIFLVSDAELQRGRVIATPVENINLYYVDPSDSDFVRAGLEYTVDGETNLIGFHTQGDYDRATSNSYALMGLTLFSEYLNGIAVVDLVAAGGSVGSLTVTSAEGTASGTTAVSVAEDPIQGGRYFYKASTTSTAPAAPAYLAAPDATWTAWDGESDIALAYASYDGKKITVIEVNGSGQTINAGDATLDIKA